MGSDKEGHMEIETRGESARPSPFSRPPQSRTATSSGSSPSAARRTPSTAVDLTQSQTTQAGLPERQALESRRRSGGQWFYWVAGLSLINTGLAVTGQTWRFILGLGITQLVQELGQRGAAANMTAAMAGLAVIGLFAFLGQRAVHGYRWAFVVGMVLYALDGLIFLLIQDWAGVGFHAFALVMIQRGYSAARQLPPPSA
jgi:hypothetical protein